MSFDFSFNPNEAITTNLPQDGQYTALITACEPKTNKAGTGFYLQTTFQIVDGEWKGFNIIDRLNVKNDNAVAENMAKKKLRQICLASGIMTEVKSAEQLLTNVPVMITTKIRKATDPQFDDSVDIVAVQKVGFTDATATGATRPVWNAPQAGGSADPF